MDCVRQFEANFVRSWPQSYEHHCFSAGIDRGPGLIIQEIVQVAHARRNFQCSFAEYRQNDSRARFTSSQRGCVQRTTALAGLSGEESSDQ
jgi:hypothetical protein